MKSNPRRIELLAPAKNLECGLEAIRHGADAVYIGAPAFGARAAAGNSLEDIRELVHYAHLFGVRIYVTLNTILSDDELVQAERLIHELYAIGVDALIVQDMGVTRLNLPPIPLHASTQMDNRTVEKVKFLEEAGFAQVVLARELTLREIRQVHAACPDLPLEVFVHGALCVSYSGQCYVSQSCFGRSANRGECAQFCRFSFDLVDARGNKIVEGKHLLSLKDMNRSDDLEALLEAGVSSFKIEGRLKDAAYVKNITAAYRQRLDEILARRPQEFVRASSGKSRLSFTPQPEKSFSRGFTSYYLRGREGGVASPDTPKSLGEEVGVVKEVRPGFFTVAGLKSFANGDGLCFLDGQGRLQGFRINRVEGNKLFPQEMPAGLTPKTKLFRNHDQEFVKLLSRPSAERKIRVDLTFYETPWGFALSLMDENRCSVALSLPLAKEPARSPQTDVIRTQLTKLGGTIFEPGEVKLDLKGEYFIPSSALADLRRRAVERLEAVRRLSYRREIRVWRPTTHAFPQLSLTYLGNVMNAQAASFYREHGVQQIEPAFEQKPVDKAVLMLCKHCIRYMMGWCPIHQRVRSPFVEPYFLVSKDGRRFRLEFDCRHCQMKVLADE